MSAALLFQHLVSEVNSFISTFGHIFCCQKGDSCKNKKEWQTVYILRRRLELFLPLHMTFSEGRDDVVGAIPKRISGLDPSLERLEPRYLKFSIASSLRPFDSNTDEDKCGHIPQ